MEFPPVVAGSSTFPVKVVSTGNRNAYARVRDGSIIISLPDRLGRGEAYRVASGLYSRISRSMRRKPEMYIQSESTLNLRDGQVLNVLGDSFRLSISAIADRKSAAGRLSYGNIDIRVPAALQGRQRQAVVYSIARRIISRAVKGKITERVDDINKKHFNSPISDVRLSEASTRWGSCSRGKSTGSSIMLNFRLLFMDERCLEYVIVHELAHTVEHGHTERFWAAVGSIIPDYRERRRLLRKSKREFQALQEQGGEPGRLEPLQEPGGGGV